MSFRIALLALLPLVAALPAAAQGADAKAPASKPTAAVPRTVLPSTVVTAPATLADLTPDARYAIEKAEYKAQLTRDLALREALLKQQEAVMAERGKAAKAAQEALIAEAKKPPADPSDPDTPPASTARNQPKPVMEKSKAFERETYYSLIARSEVVASRRDIQLLREILSRML
jgi:hypothetical protein